MISSLPIYVSIVFILTTLLTVFLFYKATARSKTTLVVIFAWLLLQSILAFSGFYTVTDTFPPRFALTALPAILFIIGIFVTARGRSYIDSLDTKTLTLLHIVRIPVEICLYWLFLYKAVPQLMTFAGRNFDILSGITAPIVYFVCFKNSQLKNRKLLLVWNFICLGLLLNIVINALLSAPFPFQQFAFDQPNIAILYFPFTWLPCFIVMIVLYSHLTAIRRLIIYRKE